MEFDDECSALVCKGDILKNDENLISQAFFA